MKEVTPINHLLSLPDKQLLEWLEANKTATRLSDAEQGLIALWQDSQFNLTTLRTSCNFEMLSTKKTQQYSVLKMAAMLTIPLLIAVISWYMLAHNNTNKYTAFYNDEPAIPTFMANGKSNWHEAMQAYEAKDYDKTLHLLQQLNSSSDTSNYYKAICYYQLNNYNESMICLNKITKEQRYYYEARYLLAFIQAGNKDIAIAKATLQEIPPSHYLASAAKKFREALAQ